jgi:hypothetical protein
MPLAENAANSAVDALESVEALDGAALKLAGAVSSAVPSVCCGTRYPAPGSAMRSIRC